ncbi:hypothetical protein PV797_14255 [Clostridiaceae bacterium M8S5]|nr:hypothetical protein PV797_14255 [Clostridiaceae bacterium M8S5]
MKDQKLGKVKELVDKGYKCIRYDHDKGNLKAFFKHFEEEMSDELTCSNKKEIKKIIDYINNSKE